ncbi:MAG: sodium/solute symporter [Planctomycetes bacterium]|nr:sodium/solute symporter [Planctomycetota bacterium]
MTRTLLAAAWLLGACSIAIPAEAPPAPPSAQVLTWSQLPDLPPAPGRTSQPGLAGAFAGVHGDALIVAGGTNFPDSPPWEGGRKAWYADVFVLLPGADGKARWRTDAAWRLPRPIAYGVSVGTPEGVLCIGGCDADRCYADCFLMGWDPARQAVWTRALPPLPRPLAFASAAKVGDGVYVAGGQESMKDGRATRDFFALHVTAAKDANASVWHTLPAWPGPPRILPVVAEQSDGSADCFYMFSGRNVAPDAAAEPLTDAWKYSPNANAWMRVADVAVDGRPRCLMAGTAIDSGANHILLFGGADAEPFRELERLSAAQKADPDSPAAAAARQRERAILTDHPGFSRDVLAYHTVTDTWRKVGDLPTGSHVTTTAVRWGNRIVIPTGEIRPGTRTPQVWAAEPQSMGRFGALNYAVLGVYLLALVGMGVYFSKREKTTDDYFRAGRRVPWWAAGLSIFGTQLSALTFMAIPAKTFATDWRYFVGNLAIVIVAPLIVLLFLPFYRRLDVTSAYEYLERRFNLAARLLGSVMFVLFQFGRIGIVLFLPSLALNLVTGMSVDLCILLMGALCIFYTVLGGIEAVIWTDVLQVFVLMGGALLCLALISFQVPGGWNGLWDAADAAGKLRVLDLRWDVVAPTFWVLLLGGVGANLVSYGTDQAVIQRYLTTKDERAAAKSIWTNAILCVPSSLLFFGIGTALFVFFRSRPQALNPVLANTDAIFPWYVVTQLPDGVAGLLIAGVFAAAMSSLDSSMNSIATVVTTDFYRRFRPRTSDRSCLRLARVATAAAGILGTALALSMARWDIKSLWDQFARVLGLFGGGLAGLFLLAIFTRRVGGAAAVLGLAASAAVQYAVQRYVPMHPWFYTVTGITACFAVGCLASYILPPCRKDLAGLTVYTMGGRNPS